MKETAIVTTTITRERKASKEKRRRRIDFPSHHGFRGKVKNAFAT